MVSKAGKLEVFLGVKLTIYLYVFSEKCSPAGFHCLHRIKLLFYVIILVSFILST